MQQDDLLTSHPSHWPTQAGAPLRTRVAASFASISAALISDRHSCGRQNRLCTAMLQGRRAGAGAGGSTNQVRQGDAGCTFFV